MIEIGKKVAFGFNAVVAGQKTGGNTEPQLIANSTPGKFTITAAVSKAMGIAVGEYVQFVHNMDVIEKLIVDGSEDIKAIAAELGADLTSREGQLAVIEACTQWGIVKGQPMIDSKGKAIMVSARLTEDDKRAFIKENAADILAASREVLIDRVGNPDASDEELLAALELDEVEYPKVPGFTGSKTASTSNATGVGLQLGFTDSAVWKQLKKDLGDNASKKNRIYDVLVDEAVKTTVDGKDMTIYPIVFKEDSDPIVRGEK
jgi:hypothetical protein